MRAQFLLCHRITFKDEHINNLRTKVSQAIGFLKYSREFLPQYTLGEKYRGIVEPHFQFCCSVWGCCGVTKLQTLQKLQNRAARILVKSSFDAPAMTIIRSLNWPTVDDIIRSAIATNVLIVKWPRPRVSFQPVQKKNRLEMLEN